MKSLMYCYSIYIIVTWSVLVINNLTISISMLLQTQDLRVNQEKEPCIRVNIRELNRELYTG